MMTLKSIARDWLPPMVVRWLHQKRGGGICFEGDFATWEDAASRGTGYDAAGILAKVLEATLKVKRGEAVFERDSVVFNEIEYSWPILAGLMWVAASHQGRLNVLDFGGALGSSYFQNLKFLKKLRQVHWNVVEQPHFVEVGLKHIAGEHLRFYHSIESCTEENPVNAVLLSSVLQYLPNPFSVLEELLAIQAATLILDRTSFLTTPGRATIKVQNVPSTIYEASYPCHIFDEDKLCQFISSRGYKLIESFGSLDEFDADTSWRGLIFQSINS